MKYTAIFYKGEVPTSHDLGHIEDAQELRLRATHLLNNKGYEKAFLAWPGGNMEITRVAP